jgi:hypothetical protein
MVQSEFARTLERELGQLRVAASDALKHARNGRYSAVNVTDAAEAFDALDRILANVTAPPVAAATACSPCRDIGKIGNYYGCLSLSIKRNKRPIALRL